LTLDDGLIINAAIINRAKSNDGEALQTIGYTYRNKRRYPNAMTWHQLAINQNNTNAYINIGCLYSGGEGVPQDNLTAIYYYLRAASANYKLAMTNIALTFLNENGVSANKYKALEWFIKCGEKPEEVKKLNQQGIHLREEDKSKSLREFELCY
jgi:TPR repeat protein